MKVPVDAGRLRDLTLELVSIPSPTGDTAAVAEAYGDYLQTVGMTVELLRDFPRAPTVVARLGGGAPGPILVLFGHLDTVSIPHDPPRREGDLIFGRGAADMKGAMACAAEVARVLVQAQEGFPGELVVVGIGLHEAPSGRGEDLVHLLRERSFRADGVIVCEGGGDRLPVAHMGSATFEIMISRPGISTHELETSEGTPHPILAAGRVLSAIAARSAELAANRHPWVGAETYFVGECHGGDFYNRFPNRCRLVGTRRWAPGRSLAAVEAEFQKMLAKLRAETECDIGLDLRLVRDSYRIDPEHSLVKAVRGAYQEVTGRPLELTGMKTVADASIWQEAGIPAVYHGPQGTGAHADVESVPVSELVRATRVYLLALREYARNEGIRP